MSKAAKDHDAFDASAASLPLDQIICGDNCEVMRQMPSESIDLVVTSPPYDDLRTYGGHSWDFYGVAWNLKRLLKPGGVIVWVVADATKDGSETGTSMRQALHFQGIGLNIHDTMFYEKSGVAFPGVGRYHNAVEYVFVLSAGKPKAVNIIKDRKNAFVLKRPDEATARKEYGARYNIWRYTTGGGRIGDQCAHEHPAPFPEPLARDHILSWSNPGDFVLDPFSGSGTTAKMARETGRRFIGIEVNPEYVEISRNRLAQQALPMDVA
jgi:site-specific DNA-methyltransferase (adenine-specific)